MHTIDQIFLMCNVERRGLFMYRKVFLDLLLCFESHHIWHDLCLLHKFYELSAQSVLSCILRRELFLITLSLCGHSLSGHLQGCSLGAGQLQKNITLGQQPWSSQIKTTTKHLTTDNHSTA